MKQPITLIVIGLLIATSVHAEELRDVSGHEYEDSIEFLNDRNLIHGYPDRNFYPDVRINRVEFVKIVIGALFDEENIRTCLADIKLEALHNDENIDMELLKQFINFDDVKFTDADYNEWYGPYLCVAQLENIVGGYDDGTFRPLQRVNFAEAATILARAFEVMKASRHLQRDTVWYRPFVQDLGDVRAIPLSIGGFDYFITRGEMAEMIRRLMDHREKKLLTRLPYLTYEEMSRSGEWVEYRDEEHLLSFHYSNEWPEPYMINRGEFDGGIPRVTSEWRLHLGPPLSCSGYGECIERKFTLDGYPISLQDRLLKEIDDVTVISDRAVNGSRVIVFEELGSCMHRAAAIFGEDELYVLRGLCAGDVPSLARLLQRIVDQFQVLDPRDVR